MSNIKMRARILYFFLSVVCLGLLITDATAQYSDTSRHDTLPIQLVKPDLTKSCFASKLIIPGILFSATAATWPYKENIRDVRNRFIPNFRNHFDDYLQYLPAVTVLALHAGKVKGKHELKRAIASYVISMAIMGSVVNVTKHATRLERPDASSKNSFPSGHTATAFLNATWLHQEYGEINTLYSIGGYSLAMMTGIGRGINNRHWVTDVLAGAAVGIVSAELGEFLASKIFKDQGVNFPLLSSPILRGSPPSFLEMHLGYAFMTSGDLSPLMQNGAFARPGFNLGVEGAWFPSKHIGIGGEFAFASFPVSSNQILSEQGIKKVPDHNYVQALGTSYFHIGSYFSLPLSNQWVITGKLATGIALASNGNMIMDLNEKYGKQLNAKQLVVANYQSQPAMSLSTGLGIQKMLSRNTSIKLYGTFFKSTHQFKTIVPNQAYNPGVPVFQSPSNQSGKLKSDHFSVGLAFTAFMW
ncbi:phosphatase PAP2 family protein [Pedobacter sp. N36a]|uniref:phosphatase PAP2 family protein n=1 Tax=Pedobacter sp. N36a TaxID=2767996 RepID=UPI001656FBB5|nr:phosphatase PAP2 family protein [Pedobacter sp. N36a]MBC8986804.1 phosphatase PAP2 family protein [Pedobacter sp. N36a]